MAANVSPKVDPSWTGNQEYLSTFRRKRSVNFAARKWTPTSNPPASAAKVVHFLRHGQGHHNLRALQPGRQCNCISGNFDSCPFSDPDVVDACLTAQGQAEARAVRDISLEPLGLDLVVVSPLRRALETATLAFHQRDPSPPFIALEQTREHIGVHLCDKRLTISEQKQGFPHVNFELIETDHDALHSDTVRETRAEMADRAHSFLHWVSLRPEKSIAVVCHSGILASAVNSVLECDSEMSMHFKTGELRSMVIEAY